MDSTSKTDTRQDPESRTERAVYWILGLVSVVFLLIGIVVHHLPNDTDKQPSFLRHVIEMFATELGIAGAVALSLIFTIEKFTRTRHKKEAAEHLQAMTETSKVFLEKMKTTSESFLEGMKKDLFFSIYGRHIPQEVFAEVERCLLLKDVVRKNYVVNYSMAEIPNNGIYEELVQEDRDTHVLCQIVSQYELHNITDGNISSPVEMFLERPIDEKMQKFVRVETLEIAGNPIDLTNFSKDDEASFGISTSVTITAKGSTNVLFKAKSIKRKTDSEVWASRLPSDGITLHVTAPKTLDVSASANHSQALKHMVVDEEKTEHTWTLKHGIFPFQSIIFWWKTT